jgi:uncharacterized protein
MKINLLEIPPEGQTWILNRKTSELNESLRDLVGETPYSVEFTILPLNPGTFDLRGTIQTELPEDCSRCGLDFTFKVSTSFHELLMPELDTPRDAKFAKANHYSDQLHQGPDVVEYQGNHFLVGEYMHEVVALAEPFNPAPEQDSEGNCRLCKIPVKDQLFSFEEKLPAPETPFAVLKKIKV